MVIARALAWRPALLAMAIVCALQATAGAEEPSELRVGVVDLQSILRESVAAQGVRDDIQSKQTTYRQEISGKENELRDQQEELRRQRTILSPEAFAEREEEFSKRVEALQRDVGARNRELEEALAYGINQVQRAALQIIAEVAEERDYHIVLDKSQIVLVVKELDYSQEVIARLNERVPEVSVRRPPQQN